MLARSSLLVVAAIGFVALAGCGGGGSTTPPHHSTPTAAPQTIYVASSSNAILEFPTSASGDVAPSASISGSNTTLLNPIPVAVDSSGNIYTTDNHGATILRFAAGSSGNATPTTITGANTELTTLVYGLAFDSSGRIYATSEPDSQGATPSVGIFAAGTTGNTAPTYYIHGAQTMVTEPDGVAVDAAGNIYVTNAGSGTILKFPPLSTQDATPTTITTPGTNLSGIAVSASGQITVADASAEAIYTFAAGVTGTPTPIYTIMGSNTGINFPIGVALDRNGSIYVANYQGGGSGTGSITIFAATANGNVAPTSTITGTATQIANPFGIAVH